MTSDACVLRLFWCRPLRPPFDEILRDAVLPDLRSRPGVVEAYVARKGPTDLGDRLIASLWSSLDAMGEAMGANVEATRFHPELLTELTDHRLEVLPVALVVGAEGSPSVGVLRLARGTLRAVDVAGYATEVRDGVAADRAAGRGPLRLILALPGPGRFVTLSCWAGWAAIEAATGASVREPVRTQREAEVAAFTADHYELLPMPASSSPSAR